MLSLTAQEPFHGKSCCGIICPRHISQPILPCPALPGPLSQTSPAQQYARQTVPGLLLLGQSVRAPLPFPPATPGLYPGVFLPETSLPSLSPRPQAHATQLSPRCVGTGHPLLPWELSPCFWCWDGAQGNCASISTPTSTHACTHPRIQHYGHLLYVRLGSPDKEDTGPILTILGLSISPPTQSPPGSVPQEAALHEQYQQAPLPTGFQLDLANRSPRRRQRAEGGPCQGVHAHSLPGFRLTPTVAPSGLGEVTAPGVLAPECCTIFCCSPNPV